MSNLPSTRLLAVSAFICAVLASPAPSAGTISLAWDPVVHAELAGYRVYYDTVPNAYGTSVDVQTATQTTLAGLGDCTTYHVAVKAYDSAGVASDQFSSPVIGWARPSVATISPAMIERNSDHQLVIDGANFQSGVGVSFSDPAITVHQVILDGCHRIRVDVSVGPAAALGAVEVQIMNVDQVFGTGAGLLNVVDDVTGPGIASVAANAVGATTADIGWQTDEPSDSTVFFRLSGEVLYQATPGDAALVLDHQVQLQGLRPASSYEYYVQSTDADGNSTVSGTPQSFTTQASQFVYIRFEAEDAQLTPPVTAVVGAGAFEGTWIEVQAGTPAGTVSDPAGSAELGFHVPHTATWRLWARIYGVGYQNDAWLESVDAGVFQHFWPPEIGAWHWVELSSYDLDAGLHTLTLGGREAEARADRILVTDDAAFVPTEQPGSDVVAPDGVADLVATAGDGFNALAWTNPAGENGIRVVVRYRLDGLPPSSPADGLPALDTAVVPGDPGSFGHGGLVNGTTYSYSVFVLDAAGNASAPATVQSTPSTNPPEDVENLVRTDVL